MPTGYTAKLAQGDQSISDFLSDCGRGMGFMILMRDEPMDAPLPDKWEPSEYSAKKIVELQSRKDFLTGLDADARQKACDEHYAAEEEYRAKRIAKNEAQRARYQAMLKKVEAWQPSHPVMRSTRKFAIEQLTESIRFDCSYTPEPVERLSPDEWHQEQFDEVIKSLQYHEAEHAKDVARTEERNAILAVFKDELAKLQEPQP